TGSGRDAALQRILAALPAPVQRRSVPELRQLADPFEPELSGSIAIWDARRTDPSPDDYDLARRWLARCTTVAVVLLDRHQDAPDVEERIAFTIDVDPISAAERRAAWEAALERSTSHDGGLTRDTELRTASRSAPHAPGHD